VEGIEAQVETEYDDAVHRAQIAEGTGLAALTRIIDELLERLDSLRWWMRTATDDEDDNFDCDAERGIAAVVERGQQDRTIDAQFTAGWIITMIWVSLSSAYRIMRHDSSRLERFATCAGTR
jgi:hypothetical protein